MEFVLSERDAFTSADSTVVAAHRRRVPEHIGRPCLDADLDAARIAATCGLSVRYLHRLFAGSEQSVMERVWSARLDRARRLLLDAVPPRQSVAQIGYRSGFASAAAFSRAFKRLYGVSPRNAR